MVYFATMRFDIDSNKFRDFLQETFDSRVRKNSKYSLRAFARDLGLNDSTLSQLLNERRKITTRHVERVIAALKLPSSALRKFKSKNELNSDYGKIQFRQLSLDSFSTMADWFHDGILELSKMADFKADEKYISRRLDINIIQARLAVQRLKRLGLVSVDESEKWTLVCENSLVNFDDTSKSNQALKEYQKQLLDLSRKSVDETPVEKRNHTSFVVALDTNLVDEIHWRVREFQKQLVEYIESKSSTRNEVYAIQFTSFPLTKNKSEV
jgi:uncharacterized protein (TIGR02147 family)